MKAIRKLPGQPFELIELENTLESLQAQVGGYIEVVPYLNDTDRTCIICNEEGRLMGLPYNCLMGGLNFVGPILLVGTAGEEFCDVPEVVVKGFCPKE